MPIFDTSVNAIVASTTSAGWHGITTGMSLLWVNLIYFGIVLAVAGTCVGLFFTLKRGSRHRTGKTFLGH